jgi:hypothetical protein
MRNITYPEGEARKLITSYLHETWVYSFSRQNVANFYQQRWSRNANGERRMNNCLLRRIIWNWLPRRMQINFSALEREFSNLNYHSNYTQMSPRLIYSVFQKIIPYNIQTEIIVLDTARHNSIIVNKVPASNIRQADILTWLSEKKISYDPNQFRAWGDWQCWKIYSTGLKL